jgi:hypothetical protein
MGRKNVEKAEKIQKCPGCKRVMTGTITGGVGCPTLGTPECVRNTKPEQKVALFNGSFDDLFETAASVTAATAKTVGLSPPEVTELLARLAVQGETHGTYNAKELAKKLRAKIETLQQEGV